MENTQPSAIESLLFKLTRSFAVVGAILGLVVLLLVVVALLRSGGSSHVSFEDLSTNVANTVSEASASSESLSYPDNVKQYLSGDNEQILNNWLMGLSSRSERQDFLDNLSDVIDDAEDAQADVTNAINNYKTVKLSKLSGGIEKYAQAAEKAALYAAVFGLIMFITLMSLILVLLAIERNTRRS